MISQKIDQGDIYWLHLEKRHPFASDYSHPHVVVENERSMVKLCAITTNMKKVNLPGNILLEAGEANLPKQSIVDVSRVSTVEKTELGEYIGSLGMQRVDQILTGIGFLQRMAVNRE